MGDKVLSRQLSQDLESCAHTPLFLPSPPRHPGLWARAEPPEVSSTSAGAHAPAGSPRTPRHGQVPALLPSPCRAHCSPTALRRPVSGAPWLPAPTLAPRTSKLSPREALVSSPLSKGSVSYSCPTLCDPTDCSPPGSSVHGIPGGNTGVVSCFLLQRVFVTQGSNPGILP